MSLQPKDPNFEERVKKTFANQAAMTSFGVVLESVKPGHVIFTMPFKKEYTQQHGFTHGGVMGAVLDSACGFAAFSLMPADAEVLTVEFKVNFLNPARGERFMFEGNVVKAGRTVTVAESKVFGVTGEEKKLIATMTGTLMSVYGRGDIKQPNG